MREFEAIIPLHLVIWVCWSPEKFIYTWEDIQATKVLKVTFKVIKHKISEWLVLREWVARWLLPREWIQEWSNSVPLGTPAPWSLNDSPASLSTLRLGVERRREACTRTRRPCLGGLVAHPGGGLVFVTWWLKSRDRVPTRRISFVELQHVLGVAFIPSISRDKYPCAEFALSTFFFTFLYLYYRNLPS